MNSYTTTQGTVKVVNPETNGTIRKQTNGIDLKKSGICEICGNRLTNPQCTHATETEKAYTVALDEAYDNAKLPSGKDLDIESLYNKFFDAPHSVEEAYQMETAIDDEMEALHDYIDEGTGNDNEADIRADMIGRL